MQLLLDNLGATIIAGTVVLMVVTLQLQAQQTAVEQAVYYRGKSRTLTFAEMISSEFPRLGEGIDRTTSIIQEYRTTGDRTDEFAFVLSTGAGQTEIRYRLIPDTTIAIETWDETSEEHVVEQVPVYRMERTEGGGSGRIVMTNIRYWNIDLLDAAGQPTAVIADTRQVKVRLTCLFEAGTGRARVLHRTLWGSTFRPTGLRL